MVLCNLLTKHHRCNKKMIMYLIITNSKKIYDHNFYLYLAHKLQNIFFFIVLLFSYKSNF